MAKSNGGIIGPDNIPTGPLGTASGVWRLQDAFKYQGEGLWPVVTGITYPVANSLRFNSGSSDNLTRTQSSATNATKYTYSFWVKRTNLGSDQTLLYNWYDGDNHGYIVFSSSDKLNLYDIRSGTDNINISSTRVFRDVSAWYHILVAIDTTQATQSDRQKIYINGTLETAFTNTSLPSQDASLGMKIDSLTNHFTIGIKANASISYLNSYMSEVYYIDGQALDPTSFGETDTVSGNWKPKDVSGLTFGTNGFYLNFQNSGALGTDSSGNGNNFTVNNLTSVDQSTDTPTNNFCTWNPLWFAGTTVPNTSFSEGNLQVQTSTTAGASSEIQGTLGINSGKWYYEFKMTSTGTGPGLACGFANNNYTDSLTYYSDNGYKYTESGSSAYGATWTTNDIIGVAFDADNNTMTFYKNGTSQGVITSAFSNLSTDFYLPIMWDGSGSLYANAAANFGSPPYAANGYSDANGFGDFSYTVPTGYYALNTQNINLQG